MGWAVGYDSNWKRDIGYGVPAMCDHPGCTEEIDRGLGYVCCDQQPRGGEKGCGLYFCAKHRGYRCSKAHQKFTPTPDLPKWTLWKLRDPSWAQWRRDNPDQVKAMRKAMRALPKPTIEAATAATKDEA